MPFRFALVVTLSFISASHGNTQDAADLRAELISIVYQAKDPSVAQLAADSQRLVLEINGFDEAQLNELATELDLDVAAGRDRDRRQGPGGSGSGKTGPPSKAGSGAVTKAPTTVAPTTSAPTTSVPSGSPTSHAPTGVNETFSPTFAPTSSPSYSPSTAPISSSPSASPSTTSPTNAGDTFSPTGSPSATGEASKTKKVSTADEGLSNGAIAGIIIGAVVVTAAITAVFTAKFFKTKFGKVGRSANFESLYADAPVGGSGSGTTKLIDLDTAYADDDEALLGEL